MCILIHACRKSSKQKQCKIQKKIMNSLKTAFDAVFILINRPGSSYKNKGYVMSGMRV